MFSLYRTFVVIAHYCDNHNNLIPVTFVLGFYVSMVFTKWWDQFTSIPWPDRLALYIAANINGMDEKSRLLRRTIMRYVCASYVMTLSSISSSVRKRFPTLQHIQEGGLFGVCFVLRYKLELSIIF